MTFEIFVRPALRRLAGHADLLRPSEPGVLLDRASKSPGRRAYLRVDVERTPSGAPARDAAGRLLLRLAGARSNAGQGSHVLSTLASADALAAVPEALTTFRREPSSRFPGSIADHAPSRKPESRHGPQTATPNRAAPPDPRRPDRPAADGRRQRQAGHGPAGRRRGARRTEPGDAQPGDRRPERQGRCPDRGRAGRGDGRQADRRPDPPVPSAGPHRPARAGGAGPGRRGPPDPGRGRDDRADRGRDGGPDRRRRGRPDRLRYGQGCRTGVEIRSIRLLSKTGGKSGDWVRSSGDERPAAAPGHHPGDRSAGRIKRKDGA